MRLIDSDALYLKIIKDNDYDLSRTENIAQILLRIETSPTLEITVKDGTQAALEKIASTLTPREPEICLLYAMQWEDDGCCMDCVECVKNHFKEKGDAER